MGEPSWLLLFHGAKQYVESATDEDEGYEEKGGVAGFRVRESGKEEDEAGDSGGDDDGTEDFD